MERLGVIEGGAFAKLEARGFKLRWQSRAFVGQKLGQQDQIWLPRLRPEHMGETQRPAYQRGVLRRRRGRYLHDGCRELKFVTEERTSLYAGKR